MRIPLIVVTLLSVLTVLVGCQSSGERSTPVPGPQQSTALRIDVEYYARHVSELAGSPIHAIMVSVA